MRYRLRTLLIVLALGPLAIAGVWWGYGKWRQKHHPWIDPASFRPDLEWSAPPNEGDPTGRSP